MKSKLYRIVESADFASAMTYVMALFDVEMAKRNEDEADFILHSQKVERNGKLELITELKWRIDQQWYQKEKRTSCQSVEERKNQHRRLVQGQVLELMEEVTSSHPNPWGILRGVRPVKIVQALLDEGLTPEEAQNIIEQEYRAESQKAKLAVQIALSERPVLQKLHERQISLYVGIPFCPSRCWYCSFPAFRLPDQATIDAFLAVLYEEINHTAELVAQYGLEVQTIYIGGGTPTSLPSADFAKLLVAIQEKFGSSHLQEFTVEAGRPDSLNEAKIEAMVQANVTRVSINPQTMQEKTLKRIGRNHHVSDIIDSFGQLRQAKARQPFSLNMDLIAGLPGETTGDMKDTLKQIEALGPDHLTVHTLALKRASKLHEDLFVKGLAEPAELLPSVDVLAEMLELAAESAAKQNLAPYYLYRQKNMPGNLENVGYAKQGHECLYNIQIMEERQTLLALGPAASTKIIWPGWQMFSLYNPKDVKTYLTKAPIMMQRRSQALAERFAAE